MPTLKPADGPLFVVRWIRADGRNAKHKYFRREVDARRFLRKLRVGGWEAALFETETTWIEATP